MGSRDGAPVRGLGEAEAFFVKLHIIFAFALLLLFTFLGDLDIDLVSCAHSNQHPK